MFFSTPYGGCIRPACPPTPECGGGKWNAAQAQLFWYGWEGYLQKDLGCPETCPDDCPDNHTAEDPCHCCKYGGTKYLRRSVNIAIDYVASSALCVYNNCVGGELGDFQWNQCGKTTTLHSHNISTTTVDRRNGKQTISGVDHLAGSYSVVETGDCCSSDLCGGYEGTTPRLLSPGGGGCADWVDVWADLSYRCGRFNNLNDGCGTSIGDEFTIAGMIAMFAASGAGTVTPTVATVTDSKLTLVVNWDFDYVDPDGPDCPEGPGDPYQVICKATHIHATLSVTIELGSPYTFEDCVAEAESLLGNYSLSHTPFKDMPGCSVSWYAGPDSTEIPLLTYDADDGHVVHGYVRGATYETPVPLTWGAFRGFFPGFGSGTVVVQKWAMRQDCFRPYGWQDDPPATKTWNYLLQYYHFDFCDGAATYSCADKTGADRFVMCISPNGETWTNGHTWPMPTVQGERTYGDMGQAVCKDATADTWPASDPTIFIEPHCDPDCPNSGACAAPATGGCPFEPAADCT